MITLQQIKNFLNPFKGATSSANGRKGLVPAPKTNEIDEFYLNSLGNWKQVKSFKTLATNTDFNTITQDGLYKVSIPDNSINLNQPIITNTTYGTTWIIFMCANVQTAYAHGLSTGYPNTYRRRLTEGDIWTDWEDNKANITADNINVANYLTKLGFNNSSSYYKMPNGLIMQWGTITIGKARTKYSFPIAFSNTNYALTCSEYSANEPTTYNNACKVGKVSSTRFVVDNQSNNNSFTISWMAIGY